MGVTIPNEYQNRGPVPGSLYFTAKFGEDANEGAIVKCGTTFPEVLKAGAADEAIGWAQGAMVSGKFGDIVPFGPIVKVDVHSGSDAIVYGDTLSQAAGGTVKKASAVTPEKVLGICLSKSAAASGQLIMVLKTSVPDPITT